MWKLASVIAFSLLSTASPAARAAEPEPAVLRQIETDIEQWRQAVHAPGLVYGLIQDGRVIVIKGLGVQDVVSRRPVDADTRFRIASMSKAFAAMSILKLRDQGKLSLDAPVETYVPEMKSWPYPTRDSRRIRVRDLLNHSAGFVTDDPWGDRQLPTSEADFTAQLKAGVPFARAPGLTMEYSNLGYAILGRVIGNVSGKPYQDFVRETLLAPLGMSATGYDITRTPADHRALGYRWQDDQWVREPDMADGAFGVMGGLETSANDYARWVTFLLSAWPPRDAADDGPIRRATVREIVEGSNFPQGVMRSPAAGGTPCRVARTYGMGWVVTDDCDLGRIVAHGGGLPGYGSNVVLLPDKGVGVFILANRTYAGPSALALKTALTLKAAKAIADRPVPVGPRVVEGYAIARRVWAAGAIEVAGPKLAANILLDRDAPHWAQELARLKAEVGDCPAGEPVTATSALAGAFTWTCERGRLSGGFLLAPTAGVALQDLKFEVAKP